MLPFLGFSLLLNFFAVIKAASISFSFSGLSNSVVIGEALRSAFQITDDPSSETKRKTRSQSSKVSSVKHLVFPHYSHQELRAILDRRFDLAKKQVADELENSNDERIRRMIEEFHPVDNEAILLMLKRLAAERGDCRTMLDFCRYV